MAGGLFTMGAYHDANEYVPLLGYFDEVRVWNTALSASQLHSYALSASQLHSNARS